jgi:hypothetical protein
MSQVIFEPTIPVFEGAKTVHGLDCAATEIGYCLRSYAVTNICLTTAPLFMKLKLGPIHWQLKNVSLVVPRSPEEETCDKRFHASYEILACFNDLPQMRALVNIWSFEVYKSEGMSWLAE